MHFTPLLMRYLCGLVLLFSLHAAFSEEVDFGETLTPLHGLYTNKFLFNVRAMRKTVGPLPMHVFFGVHRVNIRQEYFTPLPVQANSHEQMPLSVGVSLCGPVLAWELSTETVWFRGATRPLGEEMLYASRAHIILGDLYRHSPYFRLGYDFIPLGQHTSEIVAPQNTVTRALLTQRRIIGATGCDLDTSTYQLQGAVSIAIGFSDQEVLLPLVIGSVQYTRKVPLYINRWITLYSYIIGGGTGHSDARDKGSIYNVYSHLKFSKKVDISAEYTYNSIFNKIASFHEYLGELQQPQEGVLLPHAVHIEGVRQLPTLWRFPVSIISGYERGSRAYKVGENHFFDEVNNWFGAVKVGAFNKRLQCVGGVQWNLLKSKAEAFIKVGVSL